MTAFTFEVSEQAARRMTRKQYEEARRWLRSVRREVLKFLETCDG